ncbi:Cell division control protein 16 [Escovopsis weberi]|uniref:Cell division control protein 16 n=1 Tax=Escovopsis weberi TaxID=150374 RepID=A0A0M8N0S8_ESCWE|nr:Cell division control protein 16 [Escovopsis weberi]
MPGSPPREAIPTLPPTQSHLLQAALPASPRTHRTLRRLQSAHALGARAASQQVSLVTQQQQQQRRVSQGKPPPLPALGPAIAIKARGRANSDAPSPPAIPVTALNGLPLRPHRTGIKKPVFSHGHLSLQQIIRDGPTDGDFMGALESARWKVIDEGLKSAEDGMSSLRIYVWLVLLDAPIMPTDEYLALIHRGASPAYSKIRNDTFRTLTTDPLFRRRVSEASLIRLLNAIAWQLHDAREEERSRPGSNHSSLTTGSLSAASQSRPGGAALEPGTYVQGMNVLAAPFLYAARSEAEAFVAFRSLITHECPGYVRGAMDGVHRGLALVDKVLAIVDPKLSLYLTAKGLSAEIYAFPSVLTLCACTPPLPEVLRLWDFLFAYGPHLNIVCIVAQLTIMRTQILQSPSPNKVLRSFPQLNADLIKSVTISIVKKIPDDVYAEIAMHGL